MQHLIWRREKGLFSDQRRYTRPGKHYRVPTWSRASIQDFLTFRILEEVVAEVPRYEMTLENPAYPFCRVTQGVLEIRGPVCGPTKQVIKQMDGEDEFIIHVVMDSVGLLICDDDRLDKLLENDKSILHIVISEGKAGFAIALVPKRDTSDTFIRLGLLKIKSRYLSTGLEKVKVTMIKII